MVENDEFKFPHELEEDDNVNINISDETDVEIEIEDDTPERDRRAVPLDREVEDATDEEIIVAAKMAVVDYTIQLFTNKYETVLGERGITLSGGQKQLVSIARAIIKEAPILILDDCLSAVDIETEEKIITNFKTIFKHKTTIIVTHRASAAKNADKIIILDEGRIVQEGTHKELVNKEGFYKDLYIKQLSEKENA